MSETPSVRQVKTVKKPKFVKVTEIDYKIIMLQNKGSTLSDKENERLDSLKEQKALQESQGFQIIKTAKVPTEWIAGNTPEMSTEFASSNSELNTKGETKQAYSNAFFQFRSAKKSSLISIDPAAKLDLNQVREEWKTMTDSDKIPYQKKADEEKKQLGKNLRKNYVEKRSQITKDERKKSRLEADRKYRIQSKIDKAKKLEEDGFCSKKFTEILKSKERQLSDEVKLNENLKINIGKSKTENSLVQEMIKEKEAEIEKLREKYRILHRIHKSCGLFKQ